VARTQRARVVEVTPAQAFELWTDVTRWPTFVDGFAHVERMSDNWPQAGAKIVWRSVPTGRGTVTEKVRESQPGARFQTDVLEERLIGTQTVDFEPAEEGGTAVVLGLDYTLVRKGPLAWLTDVLFIRRAQNDALARTLRRFGIEAAEQAAL
jgi:ribosome-associated toxin RatA of RatAB toxin-antitoxin module